MPPTRTRAARVASRSAPAPRKPVSVRRPTRLDPFTGSRGTETTARRLLRPPRAEAGTTTHPAPQVDDQRSTVASPRLSATRWPSRLPTLSRVGIPGGGAAAAKERDVFAPTSAAAPCRQALGSGAGSSKQQCDEATQRAWLRRHRSVRGLGAARSLLFLPPARTALQRHESSHDTRATAKACSSSRGTWSS
jgi:hypothetical protein